MIVLVYGDSKRRVDPRELLRALVERAGVPRSDRHEQLTALLIDAGELAQGLVDGEFEASGIDELTPVAAAATGLVREVAAAFLAGDRDLPLALDRHLGTLPMPDRVTVSRPEGFAFYAVYPDAWARAAERFLGVRTRVIGIRSIGLTLAAVVAAAVGSEALVSVRPTGHPFDRTLAIGPELRRALLEDNAGVIYVVVDEGPGLSGSSLASVAEWLVDHGISDDRIIFMPSHAGEPGPHASVQARRIWQTIERVIPSSARALEVFANAEDLGGGAWRRTVYGEHAWPVANPQQERRKFLVRVGDHLRLAKFAGLGRYGADTLALAQTLASHGWTPRAIDMADGFITSEWRSDAVPLDHPSASYDRRSLLRRLSEYIGFRGTVLPAGDCPGASVETLFCVILTNTEQALGPAARARFEPWERSLAQLADGLEPCKTDNRMHRWEWLVTPRTILKADAVDHHAAHDLIGAQDPLWDLVGARHELALDHAEFSAVRERVAEQLGRRWTDSQIQFFSAAYLAFQCGAATLAAQTTAEPDAALLTGEARRYGDALTSLAPSGR